MRSRSCVCVYMYVYVCVVRRTSVYLVFHMKLLLTQKIMHPPIIEIKKKTMYFFYMYFLNLNLLAPNLMA